MAKEPEKGSAEDSGKPRALKAVLVVDDDRQLASALQSILRDENYLVDVAFDGEDALLKVKVLEYDAVVCDVMMPRLDGLEVCRRIVESRPALPITSGMAPDDEPMTATPAAMASTRTRPNCSRCRGRMVTDGNTSTSSAFSMAGMLP